MSGNAASWSTSQLTTTEDLSFQSSRYVLLNDNLVDKFRVCLVAQSCLTPCDPMDCSPPGSSVHGILQACPGILQEFSTGVGCYFLLQRIFLTQEFSRNSPLEWVVISFSKESSWPRNQTQISCIGRQILYHVSHQGSPQKNLGFPCGSAGKEFAHNSGDLGLMGWEDLLEKGKATHSSILAWRIPWTV